jgi:hypothetical protein
MKSKLQPNCLAAGMLAREPVEPAFEPAREIEVGAVDGQHERAVEDAA